MNVLIIGATGYVGSSIDHALQTRGHRTRGVARSDAARYKLQSRGTEPVRADASDPDSLIPALREADAVIYAVAANDASQWMLDIGAMRAIRRTLAGTEKSFIYTSTGYVYGSTGGVKVNEDSPLAPPAIMARRPQLERIVLQMVNMGIRSHVVRPGIAYGQGGGSSMMFVKSARERRAATVYGEGTNHWATVGIADLGDMYGRILERGKPGRVYNAVDDHSFTVIEIAQAASRGAGAGGAIALASLDLLGAHGDLLSLDQRIGATRAKEELGWMPSPLSIVDDLESGTHPAAAALAS